MFLEIDNAILRVKRQNSIREDSVKASGSKDRQSPEAARRDLDNRLNEALELTFPCSDPIAVYVERTPEPDEDPEADPKERRAAMSALSSAAVTIEDGEITIAADLLAQKLGLSVDALKMQMRRGYVYSLGEQGIAEDAGCTRLTFRYLTRTWTVVVEPDGTLVENPTASNQAAPATRNRASLPHLFSKAP